MTCLSEDMFWLFSSGIVSIICLMILYLCLYWGVIHILYYSSIKMYNSMAFGTFTGLSNYHNSGLWKFRIFTSPQKENLYSLTVTLLSPVPQLLVHTCCCSISQLCLTLCDPINCGTPDSLSITISLSLLRLMSIESVMSSNHLILCCPLLLLPSVFRIIMIFFNELALHIIWPKFLGASASASVIGRTDVGTH